MTNAPATAQELVELYADTQGAAFRLRGHVFPIRNVHGVMRIKLSNLVTVEVTTGRHAVEQMVNHYNKVYFRK